MKKFLRNVALGALALCGLSASAITTPNAMYIIGTVSANGVNIGWNPKNVQQMTKEGDVFTISGVTFTDSPSYFHFVTQVNSDNSWPSTRYQATSSNYSISLGVPATVQIGSNGNSWMFTPTAGTAYTVTVDCASATVTITEGGEAEIVYPKSLYVIGQVNNKSWDPSEGIQLTSTDDGKTWTGEGTITGEGQFSFAENISTSSSDWDTNGPNSGVRYAPSADIDVTSGTEFDIYIGGSSSKSWTVSPGEYTFNVDIENMKATVTLKQVVYPKSLYVIGNIEGSSSSTWDPSKGIELTSTDDGKTWTGTGTLDSFGGDLAYFGFAEGLGTDSSDWSNAGTRFQPGSDVAVNLEGSNTLVYGTNGGWTLAAGNYTFNVDIENMSFTVTGNAIVETFPDTMYIVGASINGNGWDTFLSATGDEGVYTWTGLTIGNSFKFTDDQSWQGKYNLGTNGEDLELGVPYNYSDVEGVENIIFADDIETVENATVVLNLNENTILITGDPTYPTGPVELYVRGSWNDYGTTDQMEAADNIYTWTGNVAAPENGEYIKLKIADANWSKYNYGNAAEVEVFSDSAAIVTLESNGDDLSITNWEGGEMSVTFDLDTLELTINGTSQPSSSGNGGDEGDEGDGETTGINGIYNYDGEATIYNLQGIRISNPVKGQIYILNGKKVVY